PSGALTNEVEQWWASKRPASWVEERGDYRDEHPASRDRIRWETFARGAFLHRFLVASSELSLGGSDLSPGQPLAPGPPSGRAHQAAPPRALGNNARPEFPVRAHKPGNQAERPGRDVCHWPRPRRAGNPGE